MLEVSNLGIEFGGIRALDGVSFKSAPGKILSVIGPNGAGKTTLFNLISGIYRPQTGTVSLAGEDVTAMAPHQLARRGLSRTFQNLQIFFQMTALENVMVGRHLHERRSVAAHLLGLRSVARQNAETQDRATVLLESVGLTTYAGKSAGAMPYGALKRLEIARAMAVEPSVLLLDEPAAGCNPRETEEIDEIIQQIAGTGVSVILVEHDIRLVMKISHHIVVLNYGRKLSEGTAAEVRCDPAVIEAYLGTEQPEGEVNAVGS